MGVRKCYRTIFLGLKCVIFVTCISFCLYSSHSYDEATATMDSGYPRSIDEDFPGMDDEIDAAAYHYGIMKLQLFKYFYTNTTTFLPSLTVIPSVFFQDTCISSMNTCSTSTVTIQGRWFASWGPTPFWTADEVVMAQQLIPTVN